MGYSWLALPIKCSGYQVGKARARELYTRISPFPWAVVQATRHVLLFAVAAAAVVVVAAAAAAAAAAAPAAVVAWCLFGLSAVGS